MLICKNCGVTKNDDDFYSKNKSQCKECIKTKQRQIRLNNIEHYREYDKKRNDDPKRAEMRRKYRQTQEGKEAMKRASKNWIEKNTIKRAAHHIVNNAIRDGKIVKPNQCECCGIVDTTIHGHHDDYAYPMNVRWLCSPCHIKWHKENGEALNG